MHTRGNILPRKVSSNQGDCLLLDVLELLDKVFHLKGQSKGVLRDETELAPKGAAQLQTLQCVTVR